MVGFDGAGLENVGIDGALSQEADAVELGGFLGKDLDEDPADDLALLLRVGNPCQLIQKTVDGVDVDEVCIHLVAEDLDDLLGLALAQQTVVDVHTGKLFADGLDQQSRDDRGIYAAREGQQDLLIPDLGAQGRDLLINKGLRQGRGGDSLHAFGTFFHVCFSSQALSVSSRSTAVWTRTEMPISMARSSKSTWSECRGKTLLSSSTRAPRLKKTHLACSV